MYLSVCVCTEVCVGEPLELLVDVSDVDAGDVNKLSVSVTGPGSNPSVVAADVVTEAGPDGRQLYKCCYSPLTEGLYSHSVLLCVARLG